MRYDLTIIGNRIKNERKAHGFTQPSLINELQVRYGCSISRNTLSSIENGKGDVTYTNLQVLTSMCDLFDCELAYLLCEIDTRHRITADIQKETGLSESVIESLKNLGPERKDLLNRLVTHEKADLLSLLLGQLFAFGMRANYSFEVKDILQRPHDITPEEEKAMAKFMLTDIFSDIANDVFDSYHEDRLRIKDAQIAMLKK